MPAPELQCHFRSCRLADLFKPGPLKFLAEFARQGCGKCDRIV